MNKIPVTNKRYGLPGFVQIKQNMGINFCNGVMDHQRRKARPRNFMIAILMTVAMATWSPVILMSWTVICQDGEASNEEEEVSSIIFLDSTRTAPSNWQQSKIVVTLSAFFGPITYQVWQPNICNVQGLFSLGLSEKSTGSKKLEMEGSVLDIQPPLILHSLLHPLKNWQYNPEVRNYTTQLSSIPI